LIRFAGLTIFIDELATQKNQLRAGDHKPRLFNPPCSPMTQISGLVLELKGVFGARQAGVGECPNGAFLMKSTRIYLEARRIG
jgi:hypothetical protein